MKKHIYTLLFAVLLLFAAPLLLSAQGNDLTAKLPVDPAVTIGKLNNGLTYYIRENKKPEHRAELWLVVNAGSVLEDDDQQGLAHFAEHMAFNGTEHFKKQELVNYLESIGVRFGADLNASTSFDETIYKLQLPTDTAAIVEKGFQVLQDWAHNASYEDDEIDKERGVVIEEWRLGRGAQGRMRDKQFPILFQGSQYAHRLPIGLEPLLESFPHDAVKRFYKTWYRPDLMAVVAVGDFDKAKIESLVKDYFSGITNPPDEKPRTVFPVPDNDQPLFAIATDKEATNSSVAVYYKHDVEPENTVADYRKHLVEDLYNSMFNQRLQELSQQSNPPFIRAFSASGRFIRTKEVYLLSAFVKDNGIDTGLNALLVEAKRVRQFGFTQTELDREKENMMREIDQAYNERDKTESISFVNDYIQNYLENDPIPSVGYERELYQKYLSGITLKEVNELASKWITDKNRVVLANAPEKEGVKTPTNDELADVFAKASNETVTAYVDKVLDQPLVANIPAPGKVVDEKMIPELGVTEWKLANGVKVILKPTDFKNDEIRFTSFAPGGTSVVPDADYYPAITADNLVDASGLGNFDQTELRKALEGKIVSVSPNISELYQGVQGSASPKDMKTMFELIYLTYTQPRIDKDAVSSFMEKMHGSLQNRDARPETAFQDTLQETLTQYNLRGMPFTEACLSKMDPARSLAIYKDLYSDASGATFIFVGSFKPEEMKPFVETYLGGLPAKQSARSWKDLGIEPPSGVVEKVVKKGVEPKSQVRVVFNGSFDWSPQNTHDLVAMCSALTIKLRERLREDESGVYTIGVIPAPKLQPRSEYSVSLAFPCDPKRSDELVKKAFEIIDSVKQFGLPASYVEKVQQTEKRNRESQMKENAFWTGVLQNYYMNNADPIHILDFNKYSDAFTPDLLQADVKKYFNDKNYVKVILLPQD